MAVVVIQIWYFSFERVNKGDPGSFCWNILDILFSFLSYLENCCIGLACHHLCHLVKEILVQILRYRSDYFYNQFLFNFIAVNRFLVSDHLWFVAFPPVIYHILSLNCNTLSLIYLACCCRLSFLLFGIWALEFLHPSHLITPNHYFNQLSMVSLISSSSSVIF